MRWSCVYQNLGKLRWVAVEFKKPLSGRSHHVRTRHLMKGDRMVWSVSERLSD